MSFESTDVRRFEKVLIIPNIGKEGIAGMVERVARWMGGHGAECFLTELDAGILDLDMSHAGAAEVDLAVVLGGDGTMLHAVELIDEYDVPIAGINIGKMGFLTTAEVHQAEGALSEIFKGRYWISERVTVGCTMAGTDYRALNEIVIGKITRERLIHLSTYVNGEFFMRYSGDGLIFSSATGSTAYSLSSGGPIVTPGLRCFLLTPICAHMLFSRPMVLDASDRVTVVVGDRPELLALSIDGRLDVEIPPSSSIDFYADMRPVKIIELNDSSFYATLREKFLKAPSDEDASDSKE
jgi:NAD+ kinase